MAKYDLREAILGAMLVAGVSSMDEEIEVGDGVISLHEIIPDKTVNIEKQVELKMIIKDLPVKLRRLGLKRVAGIPLTPTEEGYLIRWRKKKMPSFKEAWEIE